MPPTTKLPSKQARSTTRMPGMQPAPVVGANPPPLSPSEAEKEKMKRLPKRGTTRTGGY